MCPNCALSPRGRCWRCEKAAARAREAADGIRTHDLLHGKQPGRARFSSESVGGKRMNKPDARSREGQ